MKILGLSAFYHDSAACLIEDGVIRSAAQEERFTRKKGDDSMPLKSIDYCLQEAGVSLHDIDLVAFYDKPLLKFDRIISTYTAYAPAGIRSFIMAMPLWLKGKIFISRRIKEELGYRGDIVFPEHHESHAASAFFPSPFEEAAILTNDGVGEWATSTIGVGRDNTIQLLQEMRFPHSTGLFYSAITYFTGFKVNSGEYKVMGLAPYGEPRFVDLMLDQLIDLKEDGSFKLNMNYFNYAVGLTMTNRKFARLFGVQPRVPETHLRQIDMDIARSAQEVLEIILLRQARYIRQLTGMKNLALGGGTALNCVANGKILQEKIFDHLWIQPAAGDAGGALGCALSAYYSYLNHERHVGKTQDAMSGSFLGCEFSNEEIRRMLEEKRIRHVRLNDEELLERTTELLGTGQIIGWFQGRMEFGPRALGNRSILADARNKEMQQKINLKIKFREGFRPFAPSVLEDQANRYFELDEVSPYMLLVCPVKNRIAMTQEQMNLPWLERLKVPRSDIPAVTHLDYSARVQTVSSETNPRYHALLNKIFEKTGCPVVINTSFNVRGEPIVRTPEDAFVCFMRTEIDYLVLGNYLLDKQEMTDFQEDRDWMKEFTLD